MYREIQLRTAQFRVALEQVSYHARCSEEEKDRFLEKPTVEKSLMPQDLHRLEKKVPFTVAYVYYSMTITGYRV